MSNIKIIGEDTLTNRIEDARLYDNHILVKDKYLLEAINNLLNALSSINFNNVTIDNQISDFSKETKQDSIITALDNLNTKISICATDNISGSVNINNNITGFSTEIKQDNILNNLDDLNNSIKTNLKYTNSQILVDSVESIAIQADSSPMASVDSNLRNGWYYTNTEEGNKLNWYFYQGANQTLTFNDINQLYFKCSHDNDTSIYDKLYISVYSKPLNDGNDGGAFYRTRRNYTIQGLTLIPGFKTFYFGQKPYSNILNEEMITLALSSIQGPNNNNEEILYITLQSQTLSTAGNVRVCVSEFGYSLGEQYVSIDLTYNKFKEFAKAIFEITSGQGGGQGGE